MTVTEARELFAFDSWATRRMFNAAATLTEAELRKTALSSFPSALATLAHIVAGDWIWLRRWKGENPTAMPVWVSAPGFADLRATLDALEAERTEFLETLVDADLERTVEFRFLNGTPGSHPLGKLMRHVVNHSTYHRGQLVTLLRQLGAVPPGTDFTTFLSEGR